MRRILLEKNFTKMFWIRALLELNIFSLVSTLFYLTRGLPLEQVMLLPVVWAVSNVLLEIPSSYLADRWGRKKTLILGSWVGIVSVAILFISHNFLFFALATILSGCKFAMISGTDEALIYDTSRELQHPVSSLSRLGAYYSGRNVLKILTPLAAAYIARDLFEIQMMYIIAIDLIACMIGLFVALSLTEPHHYMDVEEQEAGVMKDAWALLTREPGLMRVALSRALIFTSGFIIWRYHQDLITSFLGISFVLLGIVWSLAHGSMFLFKQYIIPKLSKQYTHYINRFNIIFTCLVLISGVLVWFKMSYVALISILLLFSIEEIRWPFYAEMLNRHSRSYNRATTLSLMNFVKNVCDIPLLLVASVLIAHSMILPFFLSFALAIITILFLKVPSRLYA